MNDDEDGDWLEPQTWAAIQVVALAGTRWRAGQRAADKYKAARVAAIERPRAWVPRLRYDMETAREYIRIERTVATRVIALRGWPRDGGSAHRYLIGLGFKAPEKPA